MLENNKSDIEGIDLIKIIDIAKYLWKYIVWIVIVGILGAAFCGVATKVLIKPKYQATATMYVYSENSESGVITNNEITMAKSLVNTYCEILTSETILELVVKNLSGLDLTTAQLRKMISTEIVKDTQVILVRVEADTPQTAMDITNAIAEEAPAEIVRITKAGGVEIVDYAKLPQSEINNNVIRNAVLGFLFGCIALTGVLILKLMIDRKVNVEDDIAWISDLPVLGTVPMQEGIKDKPNTGWTVGVGRRLLYEEKKRTEKANAEC